MRPLLPLRRPWRQMYYRLMILAGWRSARADLLVLGGDPREDLDLLQDWQMVVIDGRVVTPQHVAGWRTRFARFFDNPAYIILTDFLMGFLAPGYQHRAQEDGI